MTRRAGPRETARKPKDVASRRISDASRPLAGDVDLQIQFGAVLAHELRNTLTAIRWATDLLSEALDPEDPRRVHVDLIQRALDQGLATTASALELVGSNPTAARPKRARSPIESSRT